MQILRKLLWPISIIYGVITFLRNKCYDWRLFAVYQIPGKSICIGNLSVGGTGKTPHVAFLAEYLKDQLPLAILSRGYGRKTTGYIALDAKQNAQTVGDEPLLYHARFSNEIHVAVCEKRKNGILQLKAQFPKIKLILLDDAFQHRAVQAGLNILLTDYNDPFFHDQMLPTGNLREFKCGKSRADLIIVTKCPASIDEKFKNVFLQNLKFDPEKIFFSRISYGTMQCFGRQVQNPKNLLVVTGIANPKPLLEHLNGTYHVEHMNFGDHHAFKQEEIEEILQKFDTFANDDKIILTTEKDFMRLKDFIDADTLKKYPWYYQPITVEIENELKFKAIIDQYVSTI